MGYLKVICQGWQANLSLCGPLRFWQHWPLAETCRILVIVVLRSPIYPGHLWQVRLWPLFHCWLFSIRCAVDHAIVFTWLICMNGTSQYHHYQNVAGETEDVGWTPLSLFHHVHQVLFEIGCGLLNSLTFFIKFESLKKLHRLLIGLSHPVARGIFKSFRWLV